MLAKAWSSIDEPATARAVRATRGSTAATYARTPTAWRRLARQPVQADREGYRFRLAFRPPYDWDAVLAFLKARATPGVESVDEGRYRRTIVVDSKQGAIDVSRIDSGSALILNVRFPDPRALLFIVERVRRMFDLAADPSEISAQLRGDPLLHRPLGTHPGIRTPGAWDGFELAVRAILGQQISVRGATTIAGRIASMFGSPVADGRSLERVFPTPAQLVNAPLERAGLMTARARTVRALARLVMDGTIEFSARTDGRATVSALKAVPGIGDWTAEYIAMRALGEPDAFPSGDLVLRRAAGNCTARGLERRSEALIPDGPLHHGERRMRTMIRLRSCTTVFAVLLMALSLMGQGKKVQPPRFVEVRSYNLKPGTRDRFHQLFLAQALPMLRRWHVDLVAYGPSVHDSDSYFLMRAYTSLEERQRSEDAFYGSDEWKKGPREAILADIESYTTIVLPLDDAAIRGLRALSAGKEAGRGR